MADPFNKSWVREHLPAAQMQAVYNALRGMPIVVDGTTYAKTRAGVQQAIDDAAALTGSGSVLIPAGTIITSDSTTLLAKSNVTVYAQGVTFKCPANATATRLLGNTWGGWGTAVALNANAARGDWTIELTAGGGATSGLAAGDLFLLWQDLDDDGSFDEGATGAVKIYMVDSISTDTITLRTAIAQPVTTANFAKVMKVSAPLTNFHWYGGTFDNNGNTSTSTFAMIWQGTTFCSFKPERITGFSTSTGLYWQYGYGEQCDIPRADGSQGVTVYLLTSSDVRIKGYDSPAMGPGAQQCASSHLDLYGENSAQRGVKLGDCWGCWGQLVGVKPGTTYNAVAITSGTSYCDFTIYGFGADGGDLWVSGTLDAPTCDYNVLRGYAPVIVLAAGSTGNDISGVVRTTLTDNATATVDMYNHGAAQHANRTRYVALTPIWDGQAAAFPTMARDAHGSILGFFPHIDETNNNATPKIIGYVTPPIPADYVAGTMTLQLLVSTSAGGGDWVIVYNVREEFDTATSDTQLDYNTVTHTNPVPNADTKTLISRNIATNPTAGRRLKIEITFLTNHASDTETGTRSLYSAQLAYTADG